MSDDVDTRIEGFEVPIHPSLAQPVLMAGVPRQFFIVNLTISAVLTLGLKVWWSGIPLGLSLHWVAAAMTAYDPLWFEVFRRCVQHQLRGSYLEG